MNPNPLAQHLTHYGFEVIDLKTRLKVMADCEPWQEYQFTHAAWLDAPQLDRYNEWPAHLCGRCHRCGRETDIAETPQGIGCRICDRCESTVLKNPRIYVTEYCPPAVRYGLALVSDKGTINLLYGWYQRLVSATARAHHVAQNQMKFFFQGVAIYRFGQCVVPTRISLVKPAR